MATGHRVTMRTSCCRGVREVQIAARCASRHSCRRASATISHTKADAASIQPMRVDQAFQSMSCERAAATAARREATAPGTSARARVGYQRQQENAEANPFFRAEPNTLMPPGTRPPATEWRGNERSSRFLKNPIQQLLDLISLLAAFLWATELLQNFGDICSCVVSHRSPC